MKRKNQYDPVRELHELLESDDITLEFTFMLFGAEREAVRVLKHRLSDGELELYEMLGPVRRYLDSWELDELVRNMNKSQAHFDKIKEVFVSATKKGRKSGRR